MDTREVIPFPQELNLTLRLPGSKSITNRAFLCAALALGKSRIYGALHSDDTQVMIRALKVLGIRIILKKDRLEVNGTGGKFKPGRLTLDCHNAGTTTRFLTAIAALRRDPTIITGDHRMQERPIDDLVEGIKQLGAKVDYLKKKKCPPLQIQSFGFKIESPREYKIAVKGDQSSQYISALLMLGPLLSAPLRIGVVGDLVSKPYIDTTIAVMKSFGVRVQNRGYRELLIKPQVYQPCDYRVEGDATAGTYFSSMNYLHGGTLKFKNLGLKSIQGDVDYPKALTQLGKGTINMNAMPDAAMTLAVTAPFAKGETTITGLGNLRIKETDRLKALASELRRVGVQAKVAQDSIAIQPSTSFLGPHRHSEERRDEESPFLLSYLSLSHLGDSSPANHRLSGIPLWREADQNDMRIKTYRDHRMAMSFAVMGTKIPGMVIEDPDCVAKTYPGFWKDLELAYLASIKLGRKNLVLTGMRCSGKNHLGRRIARLLKRRFVDLDHEIEKDQGLPIAGIVKKHGWDYFRKVEQKICSKFQNTHHLVIATGGGVILNPSNMKALKKNGLIVFVFADPNVLAQRLKRNGNRPPLKGKDPLEELPEVWQERRPLYLDYADRVWDNTSGEVIQKNLQAIF